MFKKVPEHVIDVRDLFCDGYGLTAITSGMNRYMSRYLKKLKEESELKHIEKLHANGKKQEIKR